jgi:hypothetical protein
VDYTDGLVLLDKEESVLQGINLLGVRKAGRETERSVVFNDAVN